MTRWWKFNDYLEFTFCFDTKQTRAANLESLKKRIEKNPKDVVAKRNLSRIIPYEKLDFVFYKEFLLASVGKYLFANLIIEFLRRTRFDWNPEVRKLQSFTDFALVRDYYLIGLATMIILELQLNLQVHFAWFFLLILAWYLKPIWFL
jgi:hypothetical protein